ncbi:MAG: substrate-binding domain-containing protein [Planctomycetota bacterium]
MRGAWWMALLFLPGLLSDCGCRPEEKKPRPLRLFLAAGLTPWVDSLREECLSEKGIELWAEASGSQTACRKVTELGRSCDLLLLADNDLVTTLLKGTCRWRIDFALDEVVIAVGARAPRVSDAEADWTAVLRAEGVRLGRVDENLGPMGYRTLLVWKLAEARGARGLAEAISQRTVKIVDDVSRLAPLLRQGEIDYAFVYRSLCAAQDLRFIELDRAVNLGSDDVDYSSAEVSYQKLAAGPEETITVRGAPIVWTLTAPEEGADKALAAEFVEYALTRRAQKLVSNGLRPIVPPRFYGTAEDFEPFGGFAERRGPLK